jgi:hypothetical protein
MLLSSLCFFVTVKIVFKIAIESKTKQAMLPAPEGRAILFSLLSMNTQ